MSNACPTIRNRALTQTLAQTRSAAFTLIELLVVIAITAVLLTLLFRPLLFGFQFTSQAQAITEAQDAARVTMEQVTREIGSAAAVRDTTGQYLNMRIFTPTGNDEILAHAYNAYIDIVPARTGVNTGAPTVADPTVNPYADTKAGEGFYLSTANSATTAGSFTQPSLVSSPIKLPLSPGTTLVRYFIGLSRPFDLDYTGTNTAEEEPYINRDENQTPNADGTGPSSVNWSTTYDVTHNLNNPYILYRAEVSPYKFDKTTNSYIVNSQLFDTQTVNNVKTPILDDPDFFRITSDAAHNARVYAWYQTAKPVIATGDANLIFQSHNNRGVVQYATLQDVNVSNTGTPNQAVALSTGTALEDATDIPIVRTSVSFAPATVSDQPMSATNTSDVAQGFGSAPTDAVVPYIPTQFAAQSGDWSGNKNLLITDNSALTGSTTNNTFTTYTYNPKNPADTNTYKTGENPGDLIESLTTMSGTTATSTDVFNITQGIALPDANGDPQSNYIVLSASNGGGTLNFSTPDLPLNAMPVAGGAVSLKTTGTTTTTNTDAVAGDADPNNTANPFWYVQFNSSYSGTSYGTSGEPILQIHLKPQPQLANYMTSADQVLLPNPPLSASNYLPNIATTSFGPTATYAANGSYPSSNGRVAVNTERVYGPDETSGVVATTVPSTAVPANYPVVLYRRIPYISGGEGSIGANQYMIDYDHGIIYLGAPKTAGGSIDTTQSAANPAASTVLVAFSYQNNAFIPLNQPGSTGTAYEINPALLADGGIRADTVRATYQTNSRIEVAVGVRLYDAQSNSPTYFSLANAVTVGNANR